MHIRFGRRGRLITLASGMAAAAAVAIAASGPALADTADTGGTAAISVPQSFVTGLAKSSVILFAGAPATSSYATGTDTYSLTVTGGNGEVSTFSGVVDLGGTLVAVNAANGKTAAISNLEGGHDGLQAGRRPRWVYHDVRRDGQLAGGHGKGGRDSNG